MPFQMLDPAIQAYAEQYTTGESELLKQLNAYTQANIYAPQMLSGPLQGALLTMVSKMVQPKYIIEIGTYTGYSAICLAQGLQPNGQLFSIDKDASTQAIAQRFIDQVGLKNCITLLQGDAKVILPTLPETFDLAFIDADKRGYTTYYNSILDKMNSGGIILADNVLYDTEVLLPASERSKYAEALHQFNIAVAEDPRVEQVLLPIRDGITIIRKK